MDRRRTRGEAEIEAQLKNVPAGTERHGLLVAARDFKASWVALGQKLTQVRESRSYKQWGHRTFEAYCRTELRLKPDTANKLTRSFSFLRDHEPAAMEPREDRAPPPLDVVDLLSRARERAKLSDQQFNEIREQAFDPREGFTSKNEALKRFRELDPDAFKAQPKDPKAAAAGDGNVRKALLLAERLESFLGSIEGASGECKEHAGRVTRELRALFESKQKAA